MDGILIYIIMILIFAFIGLLIPPVLIGIKTKRYEKISGKIIDKEMKCITTVESSIMAAHYEYEYEYDGVKYKAKDKRYDLNTNLNVGDIVDIYIKKGHPDKYLYPNRVRNKDNSISYALFLLIPLIAFLIIYFI